MDDDTPKLPPSTAEENKKKIVELFLKTIKGKKSDTIKSNVRHDGKEGHWLEIEMGLKLNASNSPDFLGFEMKNDTTNKTTFGDWSANYYIFTDPQYKLLRDDFLKIFGKPNEKKNGRYSWSGEPCPQIGKFNRFGQKLIVDDSSNIIAIYSYSEDKRVNKDETVPEKLRQENLTLAKWNAESIRKKLENKFNQNGWFKCLKNSDGVYYAIVFGEPINYENWIELVRKGDVFFDSGMYQGNPRPYSQWRATNTFWASLISDRYE